MLGDAAHATTPNLGQGACLALEDAVELAMCLKRQGEMETNLKMFEKKRMKRAHSIVNQSWQLGKVAQIENPLLGYIRNHLVKKTPNKIKQTHFDKTIGYKITELKG
ncbi:FAD-dependent monooxygenase [Neobacillus sp. D3-1R]|uniref:FAD-dependent monooxygenase n=1 Tax=Neobacillus sp. D3-1R TaxID=3445778 RepID=UPI003F9FE30F